MSSKDLEKDLDQKDKGNERDKQQDTTEKKDTDINDVPNEDIAKKDIGDEKTADQSSQQSSADQEKEDTANKEKTSEKAEPQTDVVDEIKQQPEEEKASEEPIVDSAENKQTKTEEQPKEQQSDDEEKQDIENKSDEEKKEESQEKKEDKEEKKEEAEEKEDTEKEKKPNKFVLFLKKYKLAVIIAAAVILVAAAIVTTITIVNAPKIFVRSAEDFLEDTAKKEIYILKKDITVDGDLILDDDLDIDLNNKTLTVNGNLKLNLNDNANSTINIGTLKKKEYVSGGKIVASSIDISAKSANINLYSTLYTNGIIRAKKLNIYENITVTDNGILEMRSTNIVAQSSIIGNISLFTSDFELYKDTTVNAIVSDAFSNAVIYGEIINSLTGGNEVSILGNASCPEVNNAKSLYYQQDTATIDNAINIANIYIVNKLETPAQLNIEQTGTTFKCIAAEVNNADLYIFTIRDDEELIAEIESTTNQTDITQYIAEPKNYKISVRASSANPRINIPSEELQIDYNYLIKLESPTLTITKTDEDNIVLSFPSINFATVYILDINGEIIEKTATENQTTNIDLTEDMEKAGSYYIKVTASFPTNSSFTDSDTVMISYLNTIKLDTPEFTLEKSGDNIILNWQKVNNADNYILSYGEEEGKIMTKNNSVTFSAENIEDNTVFSLYAQGQGFYQTSEVANVTFEYEQLDQPQTPDYSVDENVLTITTDQVASAELYTLYINGQEIATSSSPEFTLEEYEDGDKIKIEVSAQYYRNAVSEEAIINIE